MKTENGYLNRLRALTGEQSPRSATAAFVRTHRAPGASLDSLAHQLGVSRIIEEQLPFEGGLFRIPGGELIIKLNSDSSFVRQRFTIAHELGHLLLNTVPGFRGSHGSDSALEHTCDMIAAELLMPSGEAIEFIRNLGNPSPEKLQQIAAKYSVSLQMTAIRVHSDFKLWKCAIGCWECRPRVKTAWFVGPRRWDRVEPDSRSLDLTLSSSTSVQCKELWQKGPNSDPIWLKLLRIGDGSRVLGLVGFVN